jgi:thymidylate synthase (FAD)
MSKEYITNAGINYYKPDVMLLQESGLGSSEIAARTCYDSFSSSENESVQALDTYYTKLLEEPTARGEVLENTNSIEHSDLLDTLAWTHFHHSILEHCNLTYLIRGTSRGVLQEHARHRIQAISVRSTRYTMSGIINAFVTADVFGKYHWFEATILDMGMFVVDDTYSKLEIRAIWDKLMHQQSVIGIGEMRKLSIAKSSFHLINGGHTSCNDLFAALEEGKKKRNVGDSFKHIVTDNWKVDMVVTFNLRSLKNYLTLRDSGAAYFLIRELAIAMKAATPSKYLDLIVKPSKHV